MSASKFIRDWHNITPNHANRTPTCVIYLVACGQPLATHSTESERVEGLREWAAVVCYYRAGRTVGCGSASGDSAESWWEWLAAQLPRRGAVWVVSPQAASVWTWLELWDRIDAELVSLDSAIVDSLPWIVRVDYGARRLTLLDVGNFLPRWESDGFGACQEAIRLSLAGCPLILRWHREDCGTLRPTIGGCSWNLFRHKHLTHEIAIHGHRQALDLERAAYYGGRVECLRLGPVAGPIHILDLRSAYPWAMGTADYPCRLVGYLDEATVADLRRLADDHSVCARVQLQCTTEYPFRDEQRRVKYPVGRYWTTLCGAELRRALRHREVIGVGPASWYDVAPIFESWHKWYCNAIGDAELGDCPLWLEWLKGLGRSLYGRWGMHTQEWEEMHGITPPVRWGPWWNVNGPAQEAEHCRALAGHAQRQGKRGEHPDSSPLIAACIAGRVRERMRELALLAGPHEVLYWDTDEIHVTGLGRNRLEACREIGAIVGQLREKVTADAAEYYGPRHYRIGARYVWSGVGGSKVAVGKDGLTQVVVQERTRSILARAIDGTVRWKVQTVEPATWIPPAGVDEEGWVRPLVLGGEL